ncbi:MAG TPA: bile acid:sodium symporter [Bacteroidales bacterium]|nr:bile acid:sodium symporter [Bacteroidales bacterium]
MKRKRESDYLWQHYFNRMRVSTFIEKYFWLFLLAGIGLGLWNPVPFLAPSYVNKIILGMMLFFVFLKIDPLEVLEHIRNYRLMVYLASVYMFIIPLVFYLALKYVDTDLAIGVLLLTSMPAGLSSPALADIASGNSSLSMSLVIITQIIAPFTVPFVFWVINIHGMDINELLLLKDIALLVFVPMIISQAVKKTFPVAVSRTKHLFTSANVLVMAIFVFVVIASQRNVILENLGGLVWKIMVLYLVFILLHVIGFFIPRGETKRNRISISVSFAYMNNGMAIVLAASYFRPEILVLTVLSELPWNTLLAPFKKIMVY